VDEVVITLPNDSYENIKSCVDVCEVHKVQARILPDAVKYTTSSVQVDNIGMMPVLNISELPLDKWENKVVKRAFDVAFSVVFFCTLGIIFFPIIALLIKLTSKGPILFKQERWGLNNAKIICYKFRTMVRESAEVDEEGKYQITTKDDPRVTPIGKILRRTNLDELPQFWNVLIGNMSIVGPRPHPTPMNLESMHTVENYMLRHIVPPGITGWAQVNGLRGEVKTAKDMQRRVDFDLYYIHRWTFWMDSQIILQTVINFLRGDQNAY
jgi:putative colanic acid biosynthesis UDP-glucose lipid carrier transferase